MASKFSLFLLLPAGLIIAFSVWGCGEPDTPSHTVRYRVEVLAHGIDSASIPDPFAVDFDEDGTADQTIVTDTSLQVALSGGDEFHYTVGELPGDPPTALNDVRVFSFNRDGRYPSIFMAVERVTPERGVEPILQRIVFNDGGRLVLKSLSDFPLGGESLDCAWLASNDLPVCFYASYGGAAGMGLSRLLEFDPEGVWRMAQNSEYLSFRSQLDPQYAPPSDPIPSDARKRIMEIRDTDPETIDSLLAAGWADVARTFIDSVRVLWIGLSDQHRIYCNDLTREYGLPWPVELSMEYDQQHRPDGRWMDGFFMIGAAFFDFSGDRLLDLVSVGLHSGIFSAIQDGTGRFINAGYHGQPDEYYRVSAPRFKRGGNLTVPPCVYYGMDRDEASKPDYVDCFDPAMKKWYAVPLPDGSYWMQKTAVQFWDMNDDGMIDFAARKDDGTWTAFTFVREQQG